MWGTGILGVMGGGIAQPWMLPWLAATVIPVVLAWLAMRRPRAVRFGATEFVAHAARRQHVTRGGASVPITALRIAALAGAVLAAAGPFTAARGRSTAGGSGGADGPRVECVVAEDGDDHDGTVAVRLAIEAVGVREAEGHPGGRPQVAVVSPAAAGRNAGAVPTLYIIGDGTLPAAADARRITAAVADGASLLVCIGPLSTMEPVRGRLSAWLDDLAGIAIAGDPEPLAGAGIAVAPAVAPGTVSTAGFAAVAGPTVDIIAPLVVRTSPGGGRGPPTVLARTIPQERPLLVEVPCGRGTVCVAAVPLTLAEQSFGGSSAEPWSDLAAWPVFVPLVDRLVERLLTRASAALSDDVPRRLSLAPWLLALAAGLLLGDWMLSAAVGGPWGLQLACRAVAVLSVLAVWWGPGAGERSAADQPATDPHRGVVVLLDRSPSMGRAAGAAVGPLEQALAALATGGAGGGPLGVIARSRPVDLVAVAADTTPLGRWDRDVTASELAAVAAVPPASGASRIGDAIIDCVRGIVTGTRPAVIVVVSDGAITAGRDWAETARVTRRAGVPLVVVPVGAAAEPGTLSDAAAETTETRSRSSAPERIRVLMVDSGPRYEWRFLERVLAADTTFDVATCFLDATAPAAPDRHRAARLPLPGTAAAWNAFDVVVLGDVPIDGAGSGDAILADAWRSLATAAADDGLGIAWSPGRRWWQDTAAPSPWLPAARAGMRGPTGPRRLRVRNESPAGDWLPREPVDAEVFDVLHPVTLAASARVLAVALPGGTVDTTAADRAPAIVVDRLGSGTMLVHLCETWRWSGRDADAYAGYWRDLLRRLAEPHRLARRLVATLEVVPRVSQVGEGLRVEAVPTRDDVDLSGWRLELVADAAVSPGVAPPRPVPLLPADGRRGAMAARIEGLAAGAYSARLVPPDDLPAAPAAGLPRSEIVVVEPTVEQPGALADSGPLVAAARASAGTVVAIDEIAALPERVAAVLPRSGAGRVPAAAPEARWRLFAPHVFAHATMLVAVAALTTAWWPVSRDRGAATR